MNLLDYALVLDSSGKEAFDANGNSVTTVEFSVKGVTLKCQNIEHELSGVGTLIIGTEVLCWSNEDTKKGFTLEYPLIAIHAISREPKPCVYLQITDKDNEEVLREINLIPADNSEVEEIFMALSKCSALHPDPSGSDSE